MMDKPSIFNIRVSEKPEGELEELADLIIEAMTEILSRADGVAPADHEAVVLFSRPLDGGPIHEMTVATTVKDPARVALLVLLGARAILSEDRYQGLIKALGEVDVGPVEMG